MSTFLENVAKIEGQLVAKNPKAMDLEAGKNIKIRDIFTGLKGLGNGKYPTLADMQKTCGFQAQNVVYTGLAVMLDNMGTPVTAETVGKKQKLDGTQFLVDFLKEQGVELPTKKKAAETTDNTTTVSTDSSAS